MKTRETLFKHILAVGTLFILLGFFYSYGNAMTGECDFRLNVTPTIRTIAAGDSTHYQVTVQFIGSYDKPVNLEVSGLPDAAAGNFTVNPITQTGNGRTKLEIETGNTTPCGTYTLTVTGREEGGDISHSIDVLLIIENCHEEDFEISADPRNRAIYPGERTSFVVNIIGINGFNSAVTLNISGLPAEVEGTFTVNPVTPAPNGESTLNITSTQAASSGSYTLTISASGGSKEHSTNVTVDVVCPDFSVRIEADPDRGAAPLIVHFAAIISSTGKFSASDYDYKWDFGDGTKSDQQNPEHTYPTPGNFPVLLTVTDTCGNTKTASTVITVKGFEGLITKSFSVKEAIPGDEIFINIRAENSTSYNYSNITISDPLSPLLEYIEDNASVTPRRSGQEYIWKFPNLKKGRALSFKIKVKVSEKAAQGTITNTAYLFHDSLGKGKSI
ncbi:MAG: PKD domain-containing protein, partial [Candidatus Aminicenantes bacterium]|nr:PKD domain-containing protein [Candidatus Aminicenantes bacterium]